MKFILTGDIRHPGRVAVEADNLTDALEKADNGEFIIEDEQSDCLAFDWCGEDFHMKGGETDD